MSRILYAWELGGNLGHVGSFAPVAAELGRRGHDVLAAVRETSACARVFGTAGRWLQAPFVAENLGQGSPINYADMLLFNGYGDSERLLGLLVAWRQLIYLVRPDLIVADHAPTAILAARTLGISVMTYGSGFHYPPRVDPFPGMRPWQPFSEAALLEVNNRALATINGVLDRLGSAPLDRLSDLLHVAEDGVLTLPELDHYPERGAARYWGLIPDSQQNKAPVWPPGNGKRVFAYLRDGNPHALGTLEALARSGCSLIAFLPNPSLGHHLASLPNVAISREPLDMAHLAQDADAAVLNGGMSSTAAFLLAGKPVLCVPNHLEQFLTGWNLTRMGAGLLVSPQDIAPGLSAVVTRLLEDSRLRSAAEAFAAKYVHLDQSSVVANLADRIDALCAA